MVDVYLDLVSCYFQPSFTICHHPTNVDKFVSGSIAGSGIWEGHISILIDKALRRYPNATLLDIGANIGAHALYGAALGNKVWAVEPMTENLVKVIFFNLS